MNHPIRLVFDKQAILNDKEWIMFEDRLESFHYKKGELLLQEGEIEKYLTFIVRGSARLYTYNSKSEDISIGFASENSFCGSYSSFILQKPSLIAIQALEDMHVYRITHKHLNDLYKFSHTGERLGRINAELYLAHKEEREIILLTMSAKERYLYLLEKHPKLLHLVKLEHIATYLGITPQSLSRIRKEVSIT